MNSQGAFPSANDLKTIITDPNGAQALVEWADRLGKTLKERGLTTSQIRAIFGEVRLIQSEWSIHRERAFRRLVLLKPKMAYRARKERDHRREQDKAVEDLVKVLTRALDLVIKAPPPPPEASPDAPNTQDGNFQRFVEFFEAILAYHKAYGGR